MKIYIDSEFRCHVTNADDALKEVETDFFDGKCAAFIEGHCYKDDNGYTAIYPWKPLEELDTIQREHERQLIAVYEKSLETVGVVL